MAVAILIAVVGAAMCATFLAIGYLSGRISVRKEIEVQGLGLTPRTASLVDQSKNGAARPHQKVGTSQGK